MSQKTTFLKVKDHSVSGEYFDLIYDAELDFLETVPQPDENAIGSYYNSADYISHTDGKRSVFEWTYQFVKSIALKRKLNLISNYVSGSKRLLDVGCGTGDFLKLAQESGWKVDGIEPNEKARTIANDKTAGKVVDTDRIDSLKQNTYDIITLWHVLEHLPNTYEQLKTFRSLLKPSGTLIIAVPNYKSFDANYYKSYWAAYDVPRHFWHFSRNAIRKIADASGFNLIDIKPMKLDAFYVSLLSEKYKSGSMNPFKGFWIGLRSNLKAKRSGEYSSLIYVLKKP